MYKIVSNDLSIPDSYVGHTTNFRTRKTQHKNNITNEKARRYNLKVYKFIRENGGWDCFSIILIEKYPCKDTYEATSRERYWYETLNSSLNMRSPQRSSKEYKKDHKEERAIQQRQYYENHKEEMATKQKRPFTCECGKTITWSEKSKHFKTKFHLQYMERISDGIEFSKT
jgi:hypothetical protein